MADVDVRPELLRWAAARSGRSTEAMAERFPEWGSWVDDTARPTLGELKRVARYTGTPFGYLLLPEPPALTLPIPDYREDARGAPDQPSVDLWAVLHQSLRRQSWYRDYAVRVGLPTVDIVGVAADWAPVETAVAMRRELHFEVQDRRGTWSDQRRHPMPADHHLRLVGVESAQPGRTR